MSKKNENKSYHDRLCDFVYDKHGYVEPYKASAVDLYGLDKAIEIYKNGELDVETKNYLWSDARTKALAGMF